MPPDAARPTNWGIIGTGMIAHQFAAALAELPAAGLTAVSSRDAATAAAFARTHGVAHAHAGYDRLLDDDTVEAVYISAPHSAHEQLALDCLDAGKAVLVEKPFTVNLPQARAIVSRAQQQQVFCMEAMWTRFLPLPQELKRVIDDGSAIGTVRMMVATVGFRSPFDPANRFFDPALGGGALLDTGVYAVSLAHWLLGPAASLEGTALIGSTGVDEFGTLTMRHESDAISVITTSNRSYCANSFEVHGDRGVLYVHEPIFCPQRMTLSRFPQDSSPESASVAATLRTRAAGSGVLRRARRTTQRVASALGRDSIARPFSGNGYAYEAAEVMRCLAGGRVESDVMPLADSLAVMSTLDEIRRHWGLRYPADDRRREPREAT